jgi:type IV pilus assembly protein PilA
MGILAAVALPQYQKYVAKAEVAKAHSSMAGFISVIEAEILENGTLTVETAAGALSLPSVSGEAKLKYTGTTMAASAFKNGAVKDGIVTLTRNATTGAWACTSTGLPSPYTPKGCTNT